ncbi:MAG: sulfite exporter TauE/SafE family protein [Desulfitobacteriia bacterium]
MEIKLILLFSIIMIFALTVCGVIGFASNVIAFPLLSLILDLKTAVIILVAVSFLQSLVQTVIYKAFINYKDLLIISAFILAGMPVGYLTLNYLDEIVLKLILGLFILFIAAKNLYETFHLKSDVNDFKDKPWRKLYLLISGFLSGSFACGGPLVVIYCTKRFQERDSFRAILFGTGAVTMGVYMIVNIINGAFINQTLYLSAIAVVLIIPAVIMSSKIAVRLNSKIFQTLVNLTLILSGIITLVQVAERGLFS